MVAWRGGGVAWRVCVQASYFLGGAAITGGPVTVVGCGDESVQGDVAFAKVCTPLAAAAPHRVGAETRIASLSSSSSPRRRRRRRQ